jgi:O-acetyl-ADP-ribose deacetylase
MNRIELVQGNIVEEEVDAIVNAANAALVPGGGVDGAIHDAAGPELYAEAKTLGGCPTGSARLTKAYGRLKAKWVIHAVGPRYEGKPADAGRLASAYRESLRLAARAGAKTVAFPSISTGIYGYPLAEAAPIAIGTVAEWLAEKRDEGASIERVRFVLFDPKTFAAYEAAKNALRGG